MGAAEERGQRWVRCSARRAVSLLGALLQADALALLEAAHCNGLSQFVIASCTWANDKMVRWFSLCQSGMFTLIFQLPAPCPAPGEWANVGGSIRGHAAAEGGAQRRQLWRGGGGAGEGGAGAQGAGAAKKDGD